jgi:NADH-quinone oxidoreductase subunit N
MSELVVPMLPELVLIAVACVLFLLGVSNRPPVRRLAPMLALLALVALFVYQVLQVVNMPAADTLADPWNTVTVGAFARYVKLLTLGVGAVLVLLAWPTNAQATGSPSMDVGTDTGEFFALMLLSIAGVLMVAGANDIMLLFLAIELASIPTYIMVSMSRPLPVAQEAGVKYFFLGAMAAAVMLFGFSYLYGTTGQVHLDQILAVFRRQNFELSNWQLLAVLMLLAGFAFKIAAVPLHAYAGDVYTGAATPVTAFLAFIPKTSGMVAIVKILWACGGGTFAVPHPVYRMLWVIAILTMTVGNVLGLLQSNVKRVLAYSSIAHSGYMLVGLTALVAAAGNPTVQTEALGGVLFYLAAYGVMNAGAFGVLMLLPSREPAYGDESYGSATAGRVPPATTAETFKDLAGTGRRNVGLGLAMAVSCFSLIGIPLTVGFLGKAFLIWPAFRAGQTTLVVVTVVNAAISAAYYLRIVAAMFLTPAEGTADGAKEPTDTGAAFRSAPVTAAVTISVVTTLLLGTILPLPTWLSQRVNEAAQFGTPPTALPSAPNAARASLAP